MDIKLSDVRWLDWDQGVLTIEVKDAAEFAKELARLKERNPDMVVTALMRVPARTVLQDHAELRVLVNCEQAPRYTKPA